MGRHGKATKVEMRVRKGQIARRLHWGQTAKQICAELAITQDEYEYTVDQPDFKEMMKALDRQLFSRLDERFREDMSEVQLKAKEHSVEAVDKLILLMRDAASQSLQRDCANDLLEISGESKRAESKPSIIINQQTLQLIGQAVKEDDGNDSHSPA